MIANSLPIEATHSSLDVFEKPQILNVFESSFDQKVGPKYSPDNTSLTFEVVADGRNVIDLRKIFLEVKVRIVEADGTIVLDTQKPCFVNNTLHSLFSDCIVELNGLKISSSNGFYGHKTFIETEFSHGTEAKETILVTQGYVYEKDPSNTEEVVKQRAAKTLNSKTICLLGKVAADFFNCEKALISGSKLQIQLIRNLDNFCIISDDAAKQYKTIISETNLYVRKLTLSEHEVVAQEAALLKRPAEYHFTQVIPRTFVIGAGQSSWTQEDIFTKEPIRRFALALCKNGTFVGSNTTNPYHYTKFDLRSITITRNGYPMLGSPIDVSTDERVYFISYTSLAYGDNSHGITLKDFPNHYVLVFDLTSTQEASHEYIHPELTNGAVS